ncbi:MAG: hypothetical protein ACRD5F_06700 [Candidatus Acidiferrales bacterium]
MKIIELEKQLKALLEAVKIDAGGATITIQNKAGAKILLSGPTVNINGGALEVL